MSSAFKTLKISDVTISPYKATKTWTFYSSSYTSSGISILSGSCTSQADILNYSQEDINYRSVRQLYYSNQLPNLEYVTPLSEQSNESLRDGLIVGRHVEKRLVYDNYQQSTATSGSTEFDNRTDFPTVDGDLIKIVSIPQVKYGEAIKPGSLLMTAGSDKILDDSNGNIYDSSSLDHVGNVIYSHGIVIITNQSYQTLPFNLTGDTVSFQSEVTLYENQIRCHVNENEFNMTQNPSATINGTSGSVHNDLTGSDFRPYATSVGLYNGASQLLAVGKLAQPYPIPSNTDITFVIKYDS
jgi:hypothetical protein